MNTRRVAVIFDDRPRPETTGTYCLKALRELCAASHVLPTELESISRDHFDLFLNIDDGLRYELPRDLRPAAWWAIDTHLDIAWCVAKGRQFDAVFAAQRDGAQALRDAGITTAEWLPLACDPQIHRTHDVEKQYDVCFIGHLSRELGPERYDLVQLLRRRFQKCLVDARFFDEMAKAYSASRVVFNRSIRNDVNMRVFEALACGSLLMTNDLGDNGQAELFRDGTHLATYRDREEMLDKATYYLAHDEVRTRVETHGLQEVRARHTYLHRMQQLLTVTERLNSSKSIYPGVDQKSTAEVGREASHSDLAYFSHARPEVQALVPSTARRILDVGCGIGALGKALKERQHPYVAGIEMNETAAKEASHCLDRVFLGDALAVDLDGDTFDCIVCADVLEHLEHPGKLLRKLRKHLTTDGQLVASIPNVRHHSVVRSLLAGNWTYERAGLLDQTHLRFFTRREIEKLFYRCGYALDLISGITLPGEQLPDGSGSVRLGQLVLDRLAPDDLKEFYTYQFLVRALPSDVPSYGLTSIVIISRDSCGQVERCLESITATTDEPVEFIVVDDASCDGTFQRLMSHEDVKLLADQNSIRFEASAVRALSATRGDQVALLRHDCIVTAGWLRRMLDVLHSDVTIGIVGPSLNAATTSGQLAQLDAGNLNCLDGRAWEWAKAHAGERIEVESLEPSCLLIRRAVLEKAGLLEERPGSDGFEAANISTRARADGFRIVVARDAYVHRTELPAQVAVAACDRDCRIHTSEKSLARSLSIDPSQFALNHQPQPEYRNQPRPTPSCTLLMITYNRLDYTKLALEAVLQLDYSDLEVIVWDNASTDGTAAFLRERLAAVPHARLVASDRNMGVVHPMNSVWFSTQAELLMKVDNDTLVPRDLASRLAEYHARSSAFGVLSGFHFRPEDKQAATPDRVREVDGLCVYQQPFVGGCAVMIRRQTLETTGIIGAAARREDGPFLDGGWTGYQRRITESGLINGYIWPPVYVEHMEDARSPWCIRNDEHQQYKRAMRGMSIEQFTDALCVWRPD